MKTPSAAARLAYFLDSQSAEEEGDVTCADIERLILRALLAAEENHDQASIFCRLVKVYAEISTDPERLNRKDSEAQWNAWQASLQGCTVEDDECNHMTWIPALSAAYDESIYFPPTLLRRLAVSYWALEQART